MSSFCSRPEKPVIRCQKSAKIPIFTKKSQDPKGKSWKIAKNDHFPGCGASKSDPISRKTPSQGQKLWISKFLKICQSQGPKICQSQGPNREFPNFQQFACHRGQILSIQIFKNMPVTGAKTLNFQIFKNLPVTGAKFWVSKFSKICPSQGPKFWISKFSKICHSQGPNFEFPNF